MTQIDVSRGGDADEHERVDTQRKGWTLGPHPAQLDVMTRMLAAPAPEAHRPGQVIAGKYALLRRMGDGGMGEVWLAQHLALDAEVAIKLTRPELLATEASFRLLHEARVLARLDHPSIVRVLDSGTAEGGFPFMVMELLRGPSLRQTLLARRRLSARAAARILLPVASALAAAHAHGIVHRDLKPDNVILVPDATGALTPKVFDFGIAKCLAAPEDGFAEEGLVGSPEYMSPEQALATAPVDARSDVWAFCVLFHELVTGRSPFARRTLAETLKAVAREAAPALPAAYGDLALSSLLARGLAKDPERRWSSMQELGEHLAAWALREGVEEDAAGTAVRTHWLCPVHRPLSDPGPAPPRRTVTTGTFSLVVPATPVVTWPVATRPRAARVRRAALAALIAGLLAMAGAAALVRLAPRASLPDEPQVAAHVRR